MHLKALKVVYSSHKDNSTSSVGYIAMREGETFLECVEDYGYDLPQYPDDCGYGEYPETKYTGVYYVEVTRQGGDITEIKARRQGGYLI